MQIFSRFPQVPLSTTALTLSAFLLSVSNASIAHAQSGTQTVLASAVLEGYGQTVAADSSGTLAPVITLNAGADRVLTFSSVMGSISFNGGGNYNDPDGEGNPNSTNISAYQGISGFAFTGRAGYLLGVFIDGTTPSGTAPSSYSYSSATDAGFATLSPVLDQAFFIGDGLTGDGTGSVQQFYVPSGATELVLGYEDAGGYNGTPSSYGDNVGSVSASYSISGSASAPEPTSVALLIAMGVPAFGAVARLRR